MGKVTIIRKRRFKRPRKYIPTGRRPLRAKSFVPRRTIIITKGRVSLYKRRSPMRRIFRRFNAPMNLWRRFGQFQRDIKKIENIWKRKKAAEKRKAKTWSTKKKARFKPTVYKHTKSTWTRVGAAKPRRMTGGIRESGRPVAMVSRRRKVFKELRGGARDMSGRKYPKLGPFPKHLGPHLILDIIPTQALLKAFDVAKTYRSKDYLKNITKKALKDFRAELIEYAKIVIRDYVPKETGDLQKAMEDSIRKSKVMGFRLKMELEAPIDYAGVVNRMPEKMVRHHKSMMVKGRRSGHYLHDPKAQKGSYYLILMLIKNKAKKLIRKTIKDLIVSWMYSTPTKAYTKPHRRARWKRHPLGSASEGFESRHHLRSGEWGVSRTELERFVEDESDRNDTREVRMRTLWAKTAGEKQINVPYPEHLVKGFFEIKGFKGRVIY